MKKAKSNCKPTSKKCLNPNRIFALAFAITVFAPSFVSAAIPKKGAPIETYVREDLAQFRKTKRTDFRQLVAKWERVYGEASAPGLMKIAKDAAANDSDRYVAIMAHTRIRGPKSSKEVIDLLGDRNWMVRSAALKSVEILGLTAAAPRVLEKLEKDPALVIRAQAIETLMKIRPAGLADALVRASMDGKNYRPGDFRKGRADWIPQKALEALRELRPRGFAGKLLPLMNDAKDGRVRAQALHTIEILEARNLKKGSPFKERALAWNRALASGKR